MQRARLVLRGVRAAVGEEQQKLKKEEAERAEQARHERCMASFAALEASGTRVEAMQRAQRATAKPL